MAQIIELMPGIDSRLTESFLLSHQGVLDASVWIRSGKMIAHVTMRDDSPWTPRELQAACAFELGLHQTPREFLVLSARPLAA